MILTEYRKFIQKWRMFHAKMQHAKSITLLGYKTSLFEVVVLIQRKKDCNISLIKNNNEYLLWKNPIFQFVKPIKFNFNTGFVLFGTY